MKQNSLIMFLAAALLFTACSGIGIKLKEYPKEQCTKQPGDKTVAVINDKCGLCHSGDFATKELICERKTIIIDSVSAKRMPKFKTLTENELKTIVKWDL